jgi:hypothetical protein
VELCMDLDPGGWWSTPELSAKKYQNGRRIFHKGICHVPRLKAHSVGSALISKRRALLLTG